MSAWSTKRGTPYTEAGVKRLLCIRCGTTQATSQWQICADGNNYRPLCGACDDALNRAVLVFMRHPRAAALADEYERNAL